MRQTTWSLYFLLIVSLWTDCDVSHGFFVPTITRIRTTTFMPNHAVLCATTESYDVAVFGGGFAGLYTALAIDRYAQLQRKHNVRVHLIEPTENFVFLPLLYDLTVGTASELEVCPSYNDLLRTTGIKHVRASLKSIDAAQTKHAQLHPVANAAPETLQFKAAVIAVGASPENILASVPGALEYAQPFYTANDAKVTRRLLNTLDGKRGSRIAVVGGGFGGVELAACVQRRLKGKAAVTLLSRGPPMAGTRAEPLVSAALRTLGVTVVDNASVEALDSVDNDRISIRLRNVNTGETIPNDTAWDSVLWTAGSTPSPPVSTEGCSNFQLSSSGRLVVDPTLLCKNTSNVWAVGDCAEVVDAQSAFPKTAQVAMQQAETVARNVMACLDGKPGAAFAYQDLGSMLSLGGPNAAVLAPKDGMFAPIFTPIFDTASRAFQAVDEVVSDISKIPAVENLNFPTPDTLGLSLGSHGLGVDSGAAPGTLAGTLSGAARRAVYAARMPTNQQRAVSFVSAALSTAAALAKEASDQRGER
jgi:demethylphylloquinone reductase